MKTIISTYAVFVLLIISASKSFAEQPQPNVIVYGNEKCVYCKDTINWLNSHGIKYIYRDVELYGTYQEEMFTKLEKAGYTTTAIFPVIDINGNILMKPRFDDIENTLAGKKTVVRKEKTSRETLWRPQKNKSLNINFESIKNILKATDLIFYDDGSDNGQKLITQLKKEKIPFTLKQMNKLGNAAYFDMSSRLASLGYGNITIFPVIEVRGEMIMNPTVYDVKILLIEMISR